MGNYVIGVGNYVIASPSELGNYMIADTLLSMAIVTHLVTRSLASRS